jgi:hypothetical protein
MEPITLYVMNQRLEAILQDDNVNPSETINLIVDFYYEISKESRIRLAPLFTDSEKGLIIDTLKSSFLRDKTMVICLTDEILEGISYEKLDTKWGVDKKVLKTKLASLSFAEKALIAESVEQYRNKSKAGKNPNYQDFL